MAEGSRYETILKLASGGMATVWIGTVRGALGFRQLVAIKKPHPHLLSDEGFRGELVAEARLASMIHHANVVDVRDVEIEGDSISLVMDYIEGASLGDLLVAASRKNERLSPRVAIRVALDACAGLNAAHELVDEKNRPVGLVHRDVSPQNILVGADGISRVADFGVAKFARKHMQSTSEGSLKGKLAYMAPEYVKGETIDRRFDVFGLGVVLWESLAGKRCFRGDNEAETLKRLLDLDPDPPSKIAPELAPLDAVVACALAKNRDERFQNTTAMAAALEASALSAGLLGGHGEVAKAVKELLGPAMEERRSLVRAKLANEPSVASLMGVPNLVPRILTDRASDMPDGRPTAPNAPAPSTEPGPGTATATAATPKMGGGAPQAATLEAGSVVPSTQPMATVQPTTPRMEGAPPAPAPSPRTLPSALPLETPVPPAIGSGPLPPSGPNANNTLRSDAPPPIAEGATQLSFNDPSAAIAPSSLEVAGVPAKRRWLVPVLVGVTAIVIAVGALAIKKNQTSAATETTTTASATTTAPSASIATTPSASAAAAPPATTTSATAPAASLPIIAKPIAKPPIKPPAPPVTPTAPPPATTSGRKPPPPNPYP